MASIRQLVSAAGFVSLSGCIGKIGRKASETEHWFLWGTFGAKGFHSVHVNSKRLLVE